MKTLFAPLIAILAAFCLAVGSAGCTNPDGTPTQGSAHVENFLPLVQPAASIAASQAFIGRSAEMQKRTADQLWTLAYAIRTVSHNQALDPAEVEKTLLSVIQGPETAPPDLLIQKQIIGLTVSVFNIYKPKIGEDQALAIKVLEQIALGIESAASAYRAPVAAFRLDPRQRPSFRMEIPTRYLVRRGFSIWA